MGKKVVFLNLSYGKAQRGAETFVFELGSKLKSNYNVEIISGRQDYLPRLPLLWRFYLDPQGMQVLWFTLKSLPKIFREKYDVVIPVDGGWQTFFVRLATWAYGGKMVVSGQSGIGWHDRSSLWCFPDVFVAISTRACLWAKGVNRFVKSVYIPNGVDLKRFNSKVDFTYKQSLQDNISYNTKLSHPIVLCVGALEKSKGIDLVIKAVARLSGVSLLVVGKGKEEKNLMDLAERVLKGRFEIISLGFDKMPSVYRACDLFALTSNEREAFGIVYVEAMACGLPVIARRDEQRREIVGEAGVLVDSPEDTGKLSDSMKKALEIDWGKKPRNQAEKFDWDRITNQYEDLFEKL